MRSITWFNPPYTNNMKTRIGQQFLRLIDRHFLAASNLHKIFNRSTVKSATVACPIWAILLSAIMTLYMVWNTGTITNSDAATAETLTAAPLGTAGLIFLLENQGFTIHYPQSMLNLA